MADEAPENEDVLELNDPVDPPADPENPEVNDEEILTFGDEPEEVQETENATIRHLREELKKARKAANTSTAPAPEQPIEVGEKPTLSGCDYDEERFEAELDAYKAREAAAKRQAASKTDATEAERKAWEEELTKVNEEKAALGKPDVEDAFATVREALTPAQQALLVQTCDAGNRAKLIYALAHHPAQLEMLAALNVNDAVSVAKYAKAVGKLESQLKMVKRRTPPDPDTPEKGSAPTAMKVNAHQKQLDKMEAEWERKGGDRSHIQKFKKEHGLK